MELNDSKKVMRETWHSSVEMCKQYNVPSTTGELLLSKSQSCSSKVTKQTNVKVDEMMLYDTLGGWEESHENKKAERTPLQQLSLLTMVFKHKQFVNYNAIMTQLQIPPCEYKESTNEENPEGSFDKVFSQYTEDLMSHEENPEVSFDKVFSQYMEGLMSREENPEVSFDKVFSQYMEGLMSQETNGIDYKGDDISKTSLIFSESRYNLFDNDTVSIESLLNDTRYNKQNEILDQIRVAIACNTDFESRPCVSIVPASSVKRDDVPLLDGIKLNRYLFFSKCLKTLSLLHPLQDVDDSCTTDTKQRTKLSKFTREVRAKMRRRAEEKRLELCDSSDDNM